MIRISPRSRTWQAAYAMIDPARTTGSNSATTGWAVWSWVNNRLVVWAADAQFLLPDEIVALAFDIHERYDPVWVGVELDGLEQFLLQPLRHEMVRRGTYLPVRGVRAPRGKLDFITGLTTLLRRPRVRVRAAAPGADRAAAELPDRQDRRAECAGLRPPDAPGAAGPGRLWGRAHRAGSGARSDAGRCSWWRMRPGA